VRTTEELLEGKVATPVYKTEINDSGNPLHWPRYTLYPQKLALTSPTSGGHSVGIVRSRTKATEFSLVLGANLLPHTLAGHGLKIFCSVDISRASVKQVLALVLGTRLF
jgi:hypothetical protein